MMRGLIAKIGKMKTKSNDFVGFTTMVAMKEDKRYLEVCERLGEMTDAYNEAMIKMTEELYKQRQMINELRFRNNMGA